MDQPIEEFLRRWFDAHRAEQVNEAHKVALHQLLSAAWCADKLVDEGLTTP